jgi:hypothetical protein
VRIPAGGPGRTLLLAEPADGGWHATLDGSSVRSRVVDGWAQGYDVPAAGGRFELSHGMWWRHFWLIVQALAVAIVAVLALPGGQMEEGTGAALEAVRGWRRPRGRRSRVSDDPGPPSDGVDKSEDKSENKSENDGDTKGDTEGDGASGGGGEVSRPAGARRGRRRKAGGPDEPKADPVSGSGGSGEQGDLSESSAPVEPVEPVEPVDPSESNESSEEVGA